LTLWKESPRARRRRILLNAAPYAAAALIALFVFIIPTGEDGRVRGAWVYAGALAIAVLLGLGIFVKLRDR
jgi:peptidoglycan/LPS O-acetylase OafA/YrhL